MLNPQVNIGLINPKSPNNVHAIMRAAGNFRADAVFYTGVRYPNALKRNPNTPEMSRNVSKSIQINQVESIIDSVPNEAKIVCIELAVNAQPLTNFTHPANAFYVFGPEDSTIWQETIDKADFVVYVPTVGCMNLSATVSVVLYDRFVKSSNRAEYENNEHILNSRDTNNWLSVK